MYDIFVSGFLINIVQLFAVGAQSMFVIRSGLFKNRPFWAALSCIIGDAMVMFVGIFGVGALVVQYPAFKMIIRYCGIGFLIYYSFLSFRRAFSDAILNVESSIVKKQDAVKTVISLGISISCLNVQTWIDAVVIIGGASLNYVLSQRLIFFFGVMCASVVWDFCIAYSAQFVSKFLKNRAYFRFIDFGVGLFLLKVAYKIWKN